MVRRTLWLWFLAGATVLAFVGAGGRPLWLAPVRASETSLAWLIERATQTTPTRDGGELTVTLEYSHLQQAYRLTATRPAARWEIRTPYATLDGTGQPSGAWTPVTLKDWGGWARVVYVTPGGDRADFRLEFRSVKLMDVKITPERVSPGGAFRIDYQLSRTIPPLSGGRRPALLVTTHDPTEDAAGESGATSRYTYRIPISGGLRGAVYGVAPTLSENAANAVAAGPAGFSVGVALDVTLADAWLPPVDAHAPALVNTADGAPIGWLPWSAWGYYNGGVATYPPGWPAIVGEILIPYADFALHPPPLGPPPADGPALTLAQVQAYVLDETLWQGFGWRQKWVLRVTNGRPTDMIAIRHRGRLMHLGSLSGLRRRWPAADAPPLPPGHYFLDWCWMGSVRPGEKLLASVMREGAPGHTIELPYEALPAAARYAWSFLADGRLPPHNQTVPAGAGSFVTFGGKREGWGAGAGEVIPGIFDLRLDEAVTPTRWRVSWRANAVTCAVGAAIGAANCEATTALGAAALPDHWFWIEGGAWATPPTFVNGRWTATVDVTGDMAGAGDLTIRFRRATDAFLPPPLQLPLLAGPHAVGRLTRDLRGDATLRVMLLDTVAAPFEPVRGVVWVPADFPPNGTLLVGQAVPGSTALLDGPERIAYTPGTWNRFTLSVAPSYGLGGADGLGPARAHYGAMFIAARFLPPAGAAATGYSVASVETLLNLPATSELIPSPATTNYYLMLNSFPALLEGEFPDFRWVTRRYFPFGKRGNRPHYWTTMADVGVTNELTGNNGANYFSPFPYTATTWRPPVHSEPWTPVEGWGGGHWTRAPYRPHLLMQSLPYFIRAVRLHDGAGPVSTYWQSPAEEEDPADALGGCPSWSADITAQPPRIPAAVASIVNVTVTAERFDYGVIHGGRMPVFFEASGTYEVEIGPGTNHPRLLVTLYRDGCPPVEREIMILRDRHDPKRWVVRADPNWPVMGPHDSGLYWTGDSFEEGYEVLKRLAYEYQRRYGDHAPTLPPPPPRLGDIQMLTPPSSGQRVKPDWPE